MSPWTFQVGQNVTADETWVDVTSRHLVDTVPKTRQISGNIGEKCPGEEISQQSDEILLRYLELLGYFPSRGLPSRVLSEPARFLRQSHEDNLLPFFSDAIIIFALITSINLGVSTSIHY
jgi:hypothetical protein